MTDETLFSDALAIADPVARATFLARACPDPVQRQRVAELLAAHSDSSFLTRPAGADHAATADAPAGTGPFDPDGTRTPAPPVGEVGEVIGGKYKLIEAIGEGGMGTVWMAQQTEPVKRAVAVKLIKAGMDSKAVLARFEAERQALAMMDHPNIAKVLDAGATLDGRPYFVMELVKGIPITQFCDGRKLTPNARLELFVQVCNAIQHAHMKGVIHRDIKPSNVLVAMYDDRPVPKVIDFGVAKATGAQLTDRTLMTGFGAVVGTPEYMSPEQASFNQLDVDTRSDVYALGVLLYELLTGSTPVDRKSLGKAALLEILRIVREVEATRPSAKLSSSDALPTISANRGIEPKKLTGLMRNELDWIVMKALEKDRARRYDTANGFAADVQRYLSGEQVQAVPPSLGYRLKKAYRRNKTAVRVATAFALLMCAAVAVSSWLAVKATRAEAVAEDRRVEAQSNAEEASYVAGVLDGTLGEVLKSQQELKLQLASQRIDLDLIEYPNDAQRGLLRLARTLVEIPAIPKQKTMRNKYSSTTITTSEELLSEDRQLREFITAAILTAGQNYAPLLPPISHDGHAVLQLMINPDGKTVLTRGEDGTARLWDVRSGKPLAVLRENNERVVGCGFNTDGRTIFTDDDTDTLRFWDIPAATLRVRTKTERRVAPKVVEFNREYKVSNDRLIRSNLAKTDFGLGSIDHEHSRAELWDMATGRLVARFGGTATQGQTCQFAADGQWVITHSSRDGVVLVLAAIDGQPLARLAHDRYKGVSYFAVSPSCRSLAIAFWNPDTGELPIGVWDTRNWQRRDAPERVAPTPSFEFLNDEVMAGHQRYGLGRFNGVTTIFRLDAAGSLVHNGRRLLKFIDTTGLLENGQLVDLQTGARLHPPKGHRYHQDLVRFALDGRFVQIYNEHNSLLGPFPLNLIDVVTSKVFPSGVDWEDGSRRPEAVIVQGSKGSPAIIHLLPTKNLDVSPDLLELWVQVAVRGELGSDGEFVKWDEPRWEKKRQELAAIPPPYPNFPFPGHVATDKLHWLRAEYQAAAEKDKLSLVTELLRRAEQFGDKDEAVRWRMELEKSVTELAPPPRETKK